MQERPDVTTMPPLSGSKGSPGAPGREDGVAGFLTRLDAAFAHGVNPERVAEVLAAWGPAVDSLEPWIAFRPDRYARRRLARSPSHEVLLMCWDRDQATPIHDHDGQDGWILVVAGALAVQEYERLGGPPDLRAVREHTAPEGTLPLARGARLVVPVGGAIAEAQAPEAIHRVGSTGGRALSVHVYARPFDSFLVFDETRATATRVKVTPDEL
ncbi:MAG: cysteine dioxygenase family protein [Vicinamibacteria bacterium]|nr:cysteine dioxygenase family protein [Vicinamibacteria bacterium]